MPDEILTLPEVAGLPKVVETTLYTMAQRAESPAFKVRGKWRLQRLDIDIWIEAQKSNLTQTARPNDARSPDAILKRRKRQNDY